jgi:hypothetical protein
LNVVGLHAVYPYHRINENHIQSFANSFAILNSFASFPQSLYRSFNKGWQALGTRSRSDLFGQILFTWLALGCGSVGLIQRQTSDSYRNLRISNILTWCYTVRSSRCSSPLPQSSHHTVKYGARDWMAGYTCVAVGSENNIKVFFHTAAFVDGKVTINYRHRAKILIEFRLFKCICPRQRNRWKHTIRRGYIINIDIHVLLAIFLRLYSKDIVHIPLICYIIV